MIKERELLFLGLLQDGPKHGYQLKKLMQKIATTFTGLKSDSIYYPLQRLLKEGLVTQSQDQEGRRPTKYIYKITPQGQDEFRRLLLKNILSVEKPYFSIDLSLYFLDYIPKESKQRYLKTRLKLLGRLKMSLQGLKNNLKSPAPRNLQAILEHNQELLDAEIKFINRISLAP